MSKSLRAILLATAALAAGADARTLRVSPQQTLEGPGVSVVVEHNPFSPIFFDEKNGGIQLILHGERIATDGEVRLNPTPEQWHPVPAFVDRKLGAEPNQVVVRSTYADKGLSYRVSVTAEGDGFRIAVDLDKPLAPELVGKAGFNLDFLPSTYFGKTYRLDAASGLFPRHPTGKMATDGSGDPLPLASGGKTITLAPEDPLTRVTISSDAAPLALYDARARAQNGWFVVRSLLPAGVTRNAVVWHVRPNVIPNWTRAPVISFNQAGYTPARPKVAMIELDPNFAAPREAQLVRLEADGSTRPVLTAAVQPKGKWTRYSYAAFDFSTVREPGVYAISYAGQTTNPFRIAPDAYDRLWQTSLDTFMAAQMDHMGIREQYRVWSAPSHLDDARQAPPNHIHFDGYKMGPNLDSPFKPGEHIPGLDVGGWQDAGDYDIQTPDNAWVVRDLVWGRELFGLDWDQTSIDQGARAVEIRKPDGQPDVLQQIRHGTLQLLAQYKVFGHAIVGIIDPKLRQYAHLGDAGSQSDGRVDGDANGDDRWAFTTDLPATDLYVAGALAGASRTLATLDPALAQESLAAAKAMWTAQQTRRLDNDAARENGFGSRSPDVANVIATVELLLATRDAAYAAALKRQVPVIGRNFDWLAAPAVRALPLMNAAYRGRIAAFARAEKTRVDATPANTPFGVPISTGSWAGANQVATFGTRMYLLHQAFPEIVGREYTLNALDYVLGRHPVNSVSLVSTVGTQSKLIGYGHNRADYSFIPGGMVPGVLVVKPDFPELKTDWPFLWFENEYTVSTTSAYILAANAGMAASAE